MSVSARPAKMVASARIWWLTTSVAVPAATQAKTVRRTSTSVPATPASMAPPATTSSMPSPVPAVRDGEVSSIVFCLIVICA